MNEFAQRLAEVDAAEPRASDVRRPRSRSERVREGAVDQAERELDRAGI